MDKRTVLFILLSIVIWIVYIQFVSPRFTPPKQPSAPSTPVSADNTNPAAITPTAAANPATAAKLAAPAESFRQPATITLKQNTLKSNDVEITISNKGAAIESLVFSQYKAARLVPSAEMPGKLSIISTTDSSQYALSLKCRDSTEDLQNGLWEVVTETASSVKYRYTTAQGLVIYKTFALGKSNYALDFSVNLENISGHPVTSTLVIQGVERIPPESYNATDITGLYSYTNPPITDTLKDKEIKWYVETPAPAKVKKEMEKKNSASFTLVRSQDNIYWNGIANKYFAAILVPATVSDMDTYGFTAIDCPVVNSATVCANVGFYLQTRDIALEPGQTKNLNFLFYAGPKKASDLSVFSDLGFDKLLSYGWFGFISKVLLFILGGLFGLFRNYGVAIIALTVLIKIILFPITKKGQVSMYHLQKLQPRIKALQEQYKNDKKRLGEEQMKLWREYGVNPLSGCLPMLFQIPVFIGLYWALAQAIELRQSPFAFWITDLSQPDKLCKLPFPILGATYFHFLPIIMTVSWLIQSLTQPKSPDPQTRQQQKMFVFMPVIFGVMFYNVPSGLTLYWFVSTLLGIVEQILIKKYYFR